LPIGAYSYSQGLEWMIEQSRVHDAASASTWIDEMLRLVVAPGEAAMLWRLLGAVQRSEWAEAMDWNDTFRASRETAELRAETEQMGGSLVRLAGDLGLLDDAARETALAMAPVTLPAAYALAARGLAIDPSDALAAYVWAWLENQVLCAVKSIPLGQLAGQRLLLALGERIPATMEPMSPRSLPGSPSHRRGTRRNTVDCSVPDDLSAFPSWRPPNLCVSALAALSARERRL
jgi:urease accessory protein